MKNKSKGHPKLRKFGLVSHDTDFKKYFFEDAEQIDQLKSENLVETHQTSPTLAVNPNGILIFLPNSIVLFQN
jgi:hypothetical protein